MNQTTSLRTPPQTTPSAYNPSHLFHYPIPNTNPKFDDGGLRLPKTPGNDTWYEQLGPYSIARWYLMIQWPFFDMKLGWFYFFYTSLITAEHAVFLWQTTGHTPTLTKSTRLCLEYETLLTTKPEFYFFCEHVSQCCSSERGNLRK